MAQKRFAKLAYTSTRDGAVQLLSLPDFENLVWRVWDLGSTKTFVKQAGKKHAWMPDMGIDGRALWVYDSTGNNCISSGRTVLRNGLTVFVEFPKWDFPGQISIEK